MKFIRKVLFSRAFLVFVSIAVQLLFFVGVIQEFGDYYIFFYAVGMLISAVAVVWILNKNDNPSYKITWIILILLFPIFGGAFYIIFGTNKLSKKEKRRLRYINKKAVKALSAEQSVLDKIRLESESAAVQSEYIQNNDCCHAYENTAAEYLKTGETMFERLKEELRKAKRYIFLEYFIIEKGVMWDSILDILKEKAAMGVDVRVIYDDLGSLLTLPYKYDKKLGDMGIKCCVFNPLIPVFSLKLNNRDHRKIAIIDGCTGFTGGNNLADEYINKVEKYGHWKDSAVMLKGEAVWNLTVMFLTIWDYLSGIDEDFNKFRSDISSYNFKDADGFIQPFEDNPLNDESVAETVYINLISKATRYVYITTPYLIIDNEMATALSSAAKGGVDIRIITPYYADKLLVHEVTRSYYETLVKDGVKIYEYTPGFMHSKTYAADDKYAVVGTINMDYRSLYLHFECGVWMYKSHSIADIKEDFLSTLKLCRQITMEDIKNVKWYRKLVRLLLRIFAPLM